MTELSIVIPCYNEEKNIPLLVDRFLGLKPKNIEIELILVNNGSTDNSAEIIDKQLSRDASIKTVLVEKNVGYGYGIWTGLQAAKGKFLCWTHADMQTDIHDPIKAYEIIINQQYPERYVVKGKRKDRPVMAAMLATGMTFFETLIMGKYMNDINAQPNLFHKDFLKEMVDPPKDVAFELYFYYLALKRKFKFIRLQVYFPERTHGTSHWNTTITSKFRFIKQAISSSIKLRRRSL